MLLQIRLFWLDESSTCGVPPVTYRCLMSVICASGVMGVNNRSHGRRSAVGQNDSHLFMQTAKVAGAVRSTVPTYARPAALVTEYAPSLKVTTRS